MVKRKKKIIKKVFNSPKGTDLIDVKGDSLGIAFNKFIYRRRSKLGRLLGKIIKTIKVPSGMRTISINNHKPKIGKVTISYVLDRKR